MKPGAPATPGPWANLRSDVAVKAAGAAHGLLLIGLGAALAGPLPIAARVAAVLLLGLAMCWGANTVSHIHLHTPLFRSRTGNQLASIYLTVLLAIPQSHWRRRHLRHHGLVDRDPGSTLAAAGEMAALTALLLALGCWRPALLLTWWLPGTALGLALCGLQGRGEHDAQQASIDHHGRLYNRLWFNDGYHAAHHRWPDRHWSGLPADARTDDLHSALPPLLCWLRGLGPTANLRAGLLDRLERLSLRVPFLQRFLLTSHERALRTVLRGHDLRRIHHVVIVGGGLFPRSALLLGRLLPHARLTLLDSAQEHLELALAFLPPSLRRRIATLPATFDATVPLPVACDLLVVPLALRGDRAALYQHPPAPLVLVHDWLWRKAGVASVRVAFCLAKRMNLLSRLSRLPTNPGNLAAGSACCSPTFSSASVTAIATPS